MTLHAFMAFPYMETLDGYVQLAEAAGLRVVEQEDLTPDFARHVQIYLDALQKTHRLPSSPATVSRCTTRSSGGILWRDASAAGQVGRGRIIARKP